MAALATLPGCGDDGPSRAAFARDADAACAPALRELRTLKARIDETAAGGDPDAIFATSAGLIDRGAAVSRRLADRIETFEAPGPTADDVRAWLAGNRRQAALTARLAEAFRTQDETRIAELAEAIDALDVANNAAAAELGMRTCAERVAE